MIYMDNSATSPVKEEVFNAMIPYLKEEFGNPSTFYKLGRNAKKAVEEAREHVAKLINADTYKGEYAISYMEDFIGYKIDKPGKLLIVTSEGHLYAYNMDTKGIIRQQFMGNKALYAEIDGTIYSLRTTLVD